MAAACSTMASILLTNHFRSFPAVDIVEGLPEAYLAYPERLELGNRMAASALVPVVGHERPSLGGDFLEEISLWYSFQTPDRPPQNNCPCAGEWGRPRRAAICRALVTACAP